MPFNGLTSFLPTNKVTKKSGTQVYQCPLTGLLHFYAELLNA